MPVHKFASKTPAWLKPILIREAQRTGVPTVLLSEQLSKESFNFNEDVIYGRGKWRGGNVAGAAGVAQFIPSTARAYGLRVDNNVDERLDPEKAVRAQADYMNDLIKQHGTVERALSTYNSGNPENYKNPNIRTWYGSVGETYNYVKDITKASGVKGKLDKDLVSQMAEAAPATQPTVNVGVPPEQAFAFRPPKTVGTSAQLRQPQASFLPQPLFDIGIKPNIATTSAQPFAPGLSERVRRISQRLPETVNRPIEPPDRETIKDQPQPAPKPEAQAQQAQQRDLYSHFRAIRQRQPTMQASIKSARASFPSRSVSPMVATGQPIHTVRAGETPGQIAQRYLGNWNRWREIYSGDPRRMQIGTKLRIPTPGLA